jgi:hypothetical protein
MKLFAEFINEALSAIQKEDFGLARERLEDAIRFALSSRGTVSPIEAKLLRHVEQRVHLLERLPTKRKRIVETGRKGLVKSSQHSFCICLNTTLREKERIFNLFRIWGSLLSMIENPSVVGDLVVYFDKPNQNATDEIIDVARSYDLQKMFNRIEVCYADIPDEMNFYKRVADGTLDLKKFPYGYKSGPNLQFFSIIKSLSIRTYDFVLITETDCFPASPYWASNIYDEACNRSPFWVLGSPFRGKSKIGPDIALHMNGVAVYAPSAPNFSTLISRWENALIELSHEYPDIAYDCALELFYRKKVSSENWRDLTSELIGEYQTYRRMFIASDTIVNLAGEPERSGVNRYKFSELSFNFPGVELVHADYFVADALEYALNLSHMTK